MLISGVLGLFILGMAYSGIVKNRTAGSAPKTGVAIDQIDQKEKTEPGESVGGKNDENPAPPSEFDAVLAQLDASEKIAAYLKGNFSITDNESGMALAPADFFAKKSGGPQDAAVFATSALKQHGFESFVLRYKGEINGRPFSHAVAVFRDTDVPKYLTADSSGIDLTAHGWSFEDLLKKEEERTKASISGYAVFAPDTLNLIPASWEKRK
jgi:hypothetical protein